MVEIRVAVDDAMHVAGLTQRLATLFERASISCDRLRGEVLVAAEREPRTMSGATPLGASR